MARWLLGRALTMGRAEMEWTAANLECLAARSPVIAGKVEAARVPPGWCWHTPASGGPVLVADGIPLHNLRDPAGEAAGWVRRVMHGLPADTDTLVVLGCGLGYHLEALMAEWHGRIVVIEPDAAVLRAAVGGRDLRRVFDRVTLLDGAPAAEAAASWGSVHVVPHPPSLLRAGERLRHIEEEVYRCAVLPRVRLRILVVPPLGGGSLPLAAYCARALEELGHAVWCLDLAPFRPTSEALGSFCRPGASRAALEYGFGEFVGSVIVAATRRAQADLVLALAQAPLGPGALERIGETGAVRALWFVEDWRRLGYWREVAPYYEAVFAIQEQPLLGELERLGTSAAYLPCAADPSVHRPLRLSRAERRRWGSDVACVGAGYRNRRLALRRLLDLDLKVWGSDWEGSGPLTRVIQDGGKRLAVAEYVKVFNGAKVHVNLHSSTCHDGVDPRGDFVNPRTFELAACGAFQLVDRRRLLPPLLVPEREVATFTCAEELRERVAHFLAHPQERVALARAGRARVLREHTYRQRMEKLLARLVVRHGSRWRSRPRPATVAEVRETAGAGAVGALLDGLPREAPFSLELLTSRLAASERPLDDGRGIALFLDQFDRDYVRCHRT